MLEMLIYISIIHNYLQLQIIAVMKGVFQIFSMLKIDLSLIQVIGYPYTYFLQYSPIFLRRCWSVSQDSGLAKPHPDQLWWSCVLLQLLLAQIFFSMNCSWSELFKYTRFNCQLVLGIFAYCPFHTLKKCFECCEEWFDCQGGPAVWRAGSAEGRTWSNKASQSQNGNQSQGAGGGAEKVSEKEAGRTWVLSRSPLLVLLFPSWSSRYLTEYLKAGGSWLGDMFSVMLFSLNWNGLLNLRKPAVFLPRNRIL